jgi:hypothetical protein
MQDHRPIHAMLAPFLALLASVACVGAPTAPLVIGETFTLDSAALSETRRLNVYLPPGHARDPAPALPVLYMPDGGLDEDFLHIAGLVQVGVGNGTLRPFLLVGIENTRRRRDLTGPTRNEQDREIAPQVGGSAAFRTFLRDELMPEIRRRYRTTDERAIVGESLAGLFVVETFLLEPELFDTSIAIDPSLWWKDGQLIDGAAERLRARPVPGRTLYLASSSDEGGFTARLAAVLARSAPPDLRWHHEPMPEETHATIFHPAALRAFRSAFEPD